MRREYPLCRLSPIIWVLACAIAFPLAGQDADPPAIEPPSAEFIKQLRLDSPLAQHPRNRVEVIQAVLSMVDIGRLDLAKRYLELLNGETWTDDDLLELRDRIGTPNLIRLDQIKEIEQWIRPIVDRSNEAMLARASDEKRITNLANQILGSEQQRVDAVAELRALGSIAAPTLFHLIAANDSAELSRNLMSVLGASGSRVAPMAYCALEARNPRVQVFAIELLGRLRHDRATTDLIYLAYAPQIDASVQAAAKASLARITRGYASSARGSLAQASQPGVLARRLVDAATNRLKKLPPLEAFESIEDWTWDETSQTPVVSQVTRRQAVDRIGRRYAGWAVGLTPKEPKAIVIDLAFTISAATSPESIFQPLDQSVAEKAETAISALPQTLALLLRSSLTAGRPEIAAAATQLLEKSPSSKNLRSYADESSALISALSDSDPRVQFAAAKTVHGTQQRTAFRGARQVIDIFGRSLSSRGKRPLAVIGEVSADRGAELSGMLRELGFETLVSVSGRDAFRTAAERTDVELVVLHPNIIRWPLSETLSNLRADSRTARIPVVLYGPSRLASRFDRPQPGQTDAKYATYAETPEDLKLQIQEVLDKLKLLAPTPAQHAYMREQGMSILEQIAGQRGQRVYDLTMIEESLGWAVGDPAYTERALKVLSEIGTRKSQNLIAEFVIDSPGDEHAPAARTMLQEHIARFGNLISQTTLREVASRGAELQGTRNEQ